MREVDSNSFEEIISSQVNDLDATNKVKKEEVKEEEKKEVETASQYIGTQLSHKIGGYGETDKEKDSELIEEKKLSRIGETIGQNAEIRDGWMTVDRALFGERNRYYPSDWEFRIRPATVEAIRNWSTIDDENPNSVDTVFNEIIKSCLSIVTPRGPIPALNLRSWDRFFMILLIREYTFIDGEKKVEFTEECPTCENPITFNLTSQSLMYELPDPEIMKYFSEEDQTWLIDPREYDVDWPEAITLYLPTLEKEQNIKQWIFQRYQDGKKIDSVFIKFLPWLAPQIAKDLTIATRQIREYETKFKSWDREMFGFMDEVINNISISPLAKIEQTCQVCGEVVTADINFQDGIRSLFSMASGRKKFGSK